MGKYYSQEKIEHLANNLLRRYEQQIGRPVSAPLSAEDILEVALADELGSVLWEVIPEEEGETRFGCLNATQRVIILNEARSNVILGTPGLLNTTVAHEIGHWILHYDVAPKPQPTLFDMGLPSNNPTSSSSDRRDERNAHRFMANLLMPRTILVPRAQLTNLMVWRGLYALRDEFDVTITAMGIRLEELGFAYIDRDGAIHRSRAEASGQRRLDAP